MNRLVRILGCAACLAGLLATMGGHWLVFQSVAWASMIVNFSQQGSLSWAISRTFDGQHPCRLCLSVQAGQQQERSEKKDVPSLIPDEGPTLCFAPRRVVLPSPPTASSEAVAFVPGWLSDFIESPPTPPPRAA